MNHGFLQDGVRELDPVLSTERSNFWKVDLIKDLYIVGRRNFTKQVTFVEQSELQQQSKTSHLLWKLRDFKHKI